MNLEPSDEQVMLRDLVRRFLADRSDAAAIGSGPMSPRRLAGAGRTGAVLLPVARAGWRHGRCAAGCDDRGRGVGRGAGDHALRRIDPGRCRPHCPIRQRGSGRALGRAGAGGKRRARARGRRGRRCAMARCMAAAISSGGRPMRMRCSCSMGDMAYLAAGRPAGVDDHARAPRRLQRGGDAGAGRLCRRAHPAAGGRGRCLPGARPARLRRRTGRGDGAALRADRRLCCERKQFGAAIAHLPGRAAQARADVRGARTGAFPPAEGRRLRRARRPASSTACSRRRPMSPTRRSALPRRRCSCMAAWA